VETLLDAAGVAAGMRVLDVATGPGYVARRAAERGAVATGVDIADEMVALAFDAVVCGFGINHIPRPEHAIADFVRVVTPGGGIALSTWDRPERNRFLGILADAVRASGGTRPPGSLADPDHYRFADDDELRTLLGGAGLEEIDVRSVALSQRVSDVDELWEGMLGGSVRTAGLVVSQPPSHRQRIRAEVDRLADEYRVDGGLAIPVRAKIARGRRP
jgi:2-polyprenyl-3-methyl-5-hydroxy-6-metoxy-1,4-benzoquinol methylase